MPMGGFQIKPLVFGSVELAFPVVLAPMAGYTDPAMRTLCLDHGAGAAYTELVSAEGLRRNGGKTLHVLEPAAGEHPLAAHIFGSDPQAMAEAAKIIEQDGRFDWIDLNCGCPVKKVVSRGGGAALMKDLPLMGRIIGSVKAAVRLPVSAKTRIGFNNGTAGHLEIARVVEQGGADMVAVHARLAKNFHGGMPDWEALGEMKRALNIPVIGNGGIDGPGDAARMIAATGVDGVMVGRGAIGNPWIFGQVREGAAAPLIEERREAMAEHLRRLVALMERRHARSVRVERYTPEEAACVLFRTHIPYYVKGLFGKKPLLMKLAQLKSVAGIMAEVDLLVQKNRRGE